MGFLVCFSLIVNGTVNGIVAEQVVIGCGVGVTTLICPGPAIVVGVDGMVAGSASVACRVGFATLTGIVPFARDEGKCEQYSGY